MSRGGAETEMEKKYPEQAPCSVWSPVWGSISPTVRSWPEVKSRVGRLTESPRSPENQYLSNAMLFNLPKRIPLSDKQENLMSLQDLGEMCLSYESIFRITSTDKIFFNFLQFVMWKLTHFFILPIKISTNFFKISVKILTCPQPQFLSVAYPELIITFQISYILKNFNQNDIKTFL